MIKIKKPKVVRLGGNSRLTSRVDIDGIAYDLWYEVDTRYESALCSEKADAFVVGLLLYAIKNNHDIESEAPLTEDLKDSIENEFLEAICQKDKDAHRVKISCPVIAPNWKNNVVRATGISCGVDCLYTICRRFIRNNKFSSKDYLVINNLHGECNDESTAAKSERFRYLVKKARAFSEASGIDLIIGDTNFNSSDIPGLSFERYATFGNLFCCLCLQSMLTHYYVASAGSVDEFGYYLKQGVFRTNVENLDLLTTSCLSSSAMRIVVDGLAARNEKVRYLAAEPLAWKHLDVCHVHADGQVRNGTNDCPKCMRTVLELMELGPTVLDRFSEVFDVRYVKTHKGEYLAELIRGLMKKSLFAQQSWRNRGRMNFSYKDYICASVIVARKIAKKVFRFGRKSSVFSSVG